MKKFCVIIIMLSFLLIFSSCTIQKNNDNTISTTNEKNNYQKEILFSTQYIRTNGLHTISVVYPIITTIKTKEELNNYYNGYKDIYDLSRKDEIYSDTTIGFLNAIDKYTDDYFKENYLLILIIEEHSGSIRNEVNSITSDGKVSIKKVSPESQTQDMAQWNIIIELDKSFNPDSFSVNFK